MPNRYIAPCKVAATIRLEGPRVCTGDAPATFGNKAKSAIVMQLAFVAWEADGYFAMPVDDQTGVA